jgi:hypothetical protein
VGFIDQRAERLEPVMTSVSDALIAAWRQCADV